MNGKPLKLLFVADGRSPIAINWIQYFVELGLEVHLVSTFPSNPPLHLASYSEAPVAFSQTKTRPTVEGVQGLRRPSERFIPVILRTRLRQWLGPLTLPGAARRLQGILRRIQPDLVHAMRIPYEGMVAALALSGWDGAPPLLVSVWGNDFTLHAPSSPWMARNTRLTLAMATALHTDCRHDLRLAGSWGFPSGRPAVVLPGAGGIQLNLFYPPSEPSQRSSKAPVIINPRGIRAYVRSDTFFKSVPLILERYPQARFLCPAMAGESQAQRWLAELNIGSAMELLPRLTRSQMAGCFRQSQVAVSPSTHDGTPNTLLEAMACGCFPVAGDIESLREWIDPGNNGLLVDPSDPQALAGAVLRALDDPPLRLRAAAANLLLVQEQAEYGKVMGQALEFYRSLAASKC